MTFNNEKMGGSDIVASSTDKENINKNINTLFKGFEEITKQIPDDVKIKGLTLISSTFQEMDIEDKQEIKDFLKKNIPSKFQETFIFMLKKGIENIPEKDKKLVIQEFSKLPMTKQMQIFKLFDLNPFDLM